MCERACVARYLFSLSCHLLSVWHMFGSRTQLLFSRAIHIPRSADGSDKTHMHLRLNRFGLPVPGRLSDPQPRARQHPAPSKNYHMLPMPRIRTPRCRKRCARSPKCWACHEKRGSWALDTQMKEMLRLPRNLQAVPKVLRLSRKTGGALAHATETCTQMQEMLCLPRNLQAISNCPAKRGVHPDAGNVQAISKVLGLPRKTGH